MVAARLVVEEVGAAEVVGNLLMVAFELFYQLDIIDSDIF